MKGFSSTKTTNLVTTALTTPELCIKSTVLQWSKRTTHGCIFNFNFK